MRHLLVATTEGITALRFAIAWVAFTVSYNMALAAAKLLPKGHPSRTYCIGRVTQGRDRVLHAARAPRN